MCVNVCDLECPCVNVCDGVCMCVCVCVCVHVFISQLKDATFHSETVQCVRLLVRRYVCVCLIGFV